MNHAETITGIPEKPISKRIIYHMNRRAIYYMKISVFLFPIALFLVFLCIKLMLPDTYLSLIQEDSIIEYAQAFIYFLSSIASLLIVKKSLKNGLTLHGILYGILAVGLLFVAIEEISWGQRIFSIANPEYFEQRNVQNEISLHNLDTVQPLLHEFYILVGSYGSFSWLFVSKAKRKFFRIVDFVVPDWFISSYFFFVLFIYALFDHVKPSGGFLLWRDQEPMELLLSLGFLFFVVTNYIKLRTRLTIASTRAL